MRHLIEDDQCERRILAAILLFHTHRVIFEKSAFEDQPVLFEIPAISRSHAAEIVEAALDDGIGGVARPGKGWLRLSIEETPYEIVEDIPDNWMSLVAELRLKLMDYPGISAVEKED